MDNPLRRKQIENEVIKDNSGKGLEVDGNVTGSTIDLGTNNTITHSSEGGHTAASAIEEAMARVRATLDSAPVVKSSSEKAQSDEPEIPAEIQSELPQYSDFKQIKARGASAIQMYGKRMSNSNINGIQFNGTWAFFKQNTGTEYDIWVKENY